MMNGMDGMGQDGMEWKGMEWIDMDGHENERQAEEEKN